MFRDYCGKIFPDLKVAYIQRLGMFFSRNEDSSFFEVDIPPEVSELFKSAEVSHVKDLDRKGIPAPLAVFKNIPNGGRSPEFFGKLLSPPFYLNTLKENYFVPELKLSEVVKKGGSVTGVVLKSAYTRRFFCTAIHELGFSRELEGIEFQGWVKSSADGRPRSEPYLRICGNSLDSKEVFEHNKRALEEVLLRKDSFWWNL